MQRSNVIRLRTQPTAVEHRRPWHWGRWLTLAVVPASAFVYMLTPLSPYRHSGEPTSYTTSLAERMWIQLNDGSAVYLDANSHLEVGTFSRFMREVRLESGVALFQVARGGLHPFRVRTGSASIEDLDTQFMVELDQQQATTVSVLEGAVQLSQPVFNGTASRAQPARLAAGDVLKVSPLGGIQLTHQSLVDLARRTTWTYGMLTFGGETLAEAAQQFNRHNLRQILVEPDIADLPVRGSFSAADPETFIRRVKDSLPVESRSVQSNGREPDIRLVSKH